MGQNRLDYEKLCADALRGVVRRALMHVADKGLPPGNHSLTIEVTGTHNQRSGGAWVWLDAFDVMQ